MICNEKSTVFAKFNEADKNTCTVDYCLDVMKTAKNESCGECVLCREGTRQVYEIIKDITDGKPESDDFDLLVDLLEQIASYANCDMSKTAASICLDSMKEYEDEWDKHIRRKRCTNLICKGAYTLNVDPISCVGCGECKKACDYSAIAGDENMIHVLDVNKCVKCLSCVDACPNNAVKKAGAVNPKLPDRPVAVGSFEKPNEEGGVQRRRRRRR